MKLRRNADVEGSLARSVRLVTRLGATPEVVIDRLFKGTLQTGNVRGAIGNRISNEQQLSDQDRVLGVNFR
jgi:hypothetical protein